MAAYKEKLDAALYNVHCKIGAGNTLRFMEHQLISDRPAAFIRNCLIPRCKSFDSVPRISISSAGCWNWLVSPPGVVYCIVQVRRDSG